MYYTAKHMDELTPRQIEILKSIVSEYTEGGVAVGSEILEKKYKLGVSPATIRNEMVELTTKGYLKKSHFSAGREPSAKGFRYYITHIMQEKQMSTIDEVTYKNSLWDSRTHLHRLLSAGTKILADRTGLVAVSATNTGDMYYAGVSCLFDEVEVMGNDSARHLCDILDQFSFWQQVMQRFFATNQEVFYMLGEEDFADPAFEPIASVMGEFRVGEVQGVIGLIGPKRMKYDVYIPQVRYFSHLLEDIGLKHD